MPVRDRYESITKRTYKQSVVHLLETEYKVLGSHRVLSQLSDDLEHLHTTYYGEAQKMTPGTLCWRTQSLEDQKIKYAKRTEHYAAKTIYLPYVNVEDVEKRIRHRKGVRNDNYQWSDRREVAQMVRLLWSAYEQGTSLTIGELSVVMNRSLGVIGKYIKQYYAENPDKTLPLRGYIYDQGSNPTHKALICTLWERGTSEADIARKTNHHLKSVGHYLNHYRRVMQLFKKEMSVDEIAHLVGIGKRVVLEYTRIASHFHPSLVRKQTLKRTKKYQNPTRGHLAL
ncbi:MAG: DUF1670 domain-containing protein [Ignavibacteriales bacterium]|nr:DUF1670 domain-containing protein [Ignavibacteriales bacterium]